MDEILDMAIKEIKILTLEAYQGSERAADTLEKVVDNLIGVLSLDEKYF